MREEATRGRSASAGDIAGASKSARWKCLAAVASARPRGLRTWGAPALQLEVRWVVSAAIDDTKDRHHFWRRSIDNDVAAAGQATCRRSCLASGATTLAAMSLVDLRLTRPCSITPHDLFEEGVELLIRLDHDGPRRGQSKRLPRRDLRLTRLAVVPVRLSRSWLAPRHPPVARYAPRRSRGARYRPVQG